MRKKLFIKTWGCQMNVYDSARMADVLAPLGYDRTEEQSQADLIILNTCHIREKASVKLFSELGRLRDVQKARAEEGVKVTIAVAGCVAQAAGEEIATRAPYVSMIIGPQAYHRLPEMLVRAAASDGCVLDTDFPADSKFDSLPQEQDNQKGVSAFLAVQEGCDRFCSYCVVPYTRGLEYSRPMAAIVEEARVLVEGGAKEITLLGQNVNAYHDESGAGLAAVIEKLAAMEGLLRIRYTTSHPLDMDEALIAAHRDVPKLMPFLHLPVQSGSDKILAAMNRKHTADDYRRVVEQLKLAQPKLALSSDFIVGFPGETEEDFEATMQIVRDVTYAQAFSFKYSRRAGTPAAVMTSQVQEDVKQERLVRLQALLRQQQTDFNKACVGQTMSVLVENESRVKGHMFGRSPYMQAVRLKGDASMIGTEQTATITRGDPNSLMG